MQTTIDRLDKPKEGKLTKSVEKVTAQVPSIAYLGMAAGSMLVSASIAAFTRKKGLANFIGLWVPTLLIIGLYNKMVKIHPDGDAVVH